MTSTQIWLFLIALTAALCFGVASILMGMQTTHVQEPRPRGQNYLIKHGNFGMVALTTTMFLSIVTISSLYSHW
jgi:hypothetical protein